MGLKCETNAQTIPIEQWKPGSGIYSTTTVTCPLVNVVMYPTVSVAG
jgi:hypothetical protein